MIHPDDASFWHALSQRENAAQLIRGNLPADISERIDWSSIDVVSRPFAYNELASEHMDLLFRTNLSGREAYIYLLFEYQSKFESEMALRLLVCLARIWEKVITDKPKTEVIPPVIPLVLYRGKEGWRAAKSFRDMIEVDDLTERANASQIPNYRYIFDNLSDRSDEQLQTRVLGEAGMLALLFLQRFPDHPEPEELFRKVINLATSVVAAPSRVESLGILVWYAFRISDPDTSSVRQWLETDVGGLLLEAYQTTAERGTEQTRMIALAKADVNGRLEILRKLLTLKFGTLSREVEARLNLARVSDLDRWAERVLSAQSIHEVLYLY